MPPVQIAVCGPRDCTNTEAATAREVGRLLARAGAVVLCGGGTGVMAAVAEGASAEGGLVIGVRPDTGRAGVCAGLSAVLYTGCSQKNWPMIIGCTATQPTSSAPLHTAIAAAR